MTRRLLLQPEAQSDLEEAVLWYEEQRGGLGDAFSGELFDLLDRIAEAPLRFPAAAQAVRRGTLHRFPYVVYFVVDEPAILVIAILHQRRNPAIWRGRS
jgi:plasmid stabilization system protein ParE